VFDILATLRGCPCSWLQPHIAAHLSSNSPTINHKLKKLHSSPRHKHFRSIKMMLTNKVLANKSVLSAKSVTSKPLPLRTRSIVVRAGGEQPSTPPPPQEVSRSRRPGETLFVFAPMGLGHDDDVHRKEPACCSGLFPADVRVPLLGQRSLSYAKLRSSCRPASNLAHVLKLTHSLTRNWPCPLPAHSSGCSPHPLRPLPPLLLRTRRSP